MVIVTVKALLKISLILSAGSKNSFGEKGMMPNKN